jgi:hypothetical protein
MSYHVHPYSKTDNTFNQEIAGPALSHRGNEYLLLMIANDGIGWCSTNSERRPIYDIMTHRYFNEVSVR